MKNQEYQPYSPVSPQRPLRAEELPITFVTSSDGHNKATVFETHLPGWNISHREPFFNEVAIHDRAPHTEHRPQVIAEHKAKDDVTIAQAMSLIADTVTRDGTVYTNGAEKMMLYTDTVQMVHVNGKDDMDIVMLEKPTEDPVTWATNSPEAMIQSGKDVEIVNALTGIRVGKDGVGEPKTVMLRVRFSAKPFTREQIIAYANTPGNTIAQTSGGLSVANGAREFYDMDKPLVVSMANNMDEIPTEIMRFDTWHHLTKADLKPFICGAVEPAIARVVEKTRESAKVV